jgi:hypothetical protein
VDNVETRKGDWMQTIGERKFYPMDPRPEEVFIEDIAWSLAHQARYNGHARLFYSVAEHSILVSEALAGTGMEFAGLMHDATEAYVTDVPRPLKRYLTNYAEIEDNVWRAIAKRYDLPAELPEAVKDADNAVLMAEKPVLLGTKFAWAKLAEPAAVTIRGLDPLSAYSAFLARFYALTNGALRAP